MVFMMQVVRPQDICVYSTLQFGCYCDRAGEDLNMLLSCLINSAIIALQSVKKRVLLPHLKLESQEKQM